MSEWQFILDENIDPKVATYLEKEGVDAVHVRGSVGLGSDDKSVLSWARDHGNIVLTSDVQHFGGLPPEKPPGVVLLHDDTMPAYRVASALLRLLDAYPSREAFGGRGDLDK